MPDLKSELSKVINAWESNPTQDTPTTTSEPKAYFTVTNNVCRATFECIRDNPGKSRQELATLLEKDGFKKSSTTSLMGQMVKQGLVCDTHALLYANRQTYVPLKSSKAWVNSQDKAAPKPGRKVVTIVSKSTGKALNPRTALQPPAPQINAAWDAETLLNNLSIKQARALYDELRKIFGG